MIAARLPRIGFILTATLAIAANTLGGDAELTWVRIDVVTPDAKPRCVEGVVRVEAVDGGLLLEQSDGRLDLLQPDAIGTRTPIPPPAASETPRD